MQVYFDTLQEFREYAASKNWDVEPDGANRFIAHVDGEQRAEYDRQCILNFSDN